MQHKRRLFLLKTEDDVVPSRIYNFKDNESIKLPYT
jgi:hypothetical protein